MNFGFCKIVRKIYVMPQAINACLAITGATRGTSKEKLYDELSLDFFQLRRWLRKLYYFYKFYKDKSSQYFFKLIP